MRLAQPVGEVMAVGATCQGSIIWSYKLVRLTPQLADHDRLTINDADSEVIKIWAVAREVDVAF